MDRDACWEGAGVEGGDRSKDVCSFFPFFFLFFFFLVSCALLLTTAFASVPSGAVHSLPLKQPQKGLGLSAVIGGLSPPGLFYKLPDTPTCRLCT